MLIKKPKKASDKLVGFDPNYKIPKNLPTVAATGKRQSKIKFANGSSVEFYHAEDDTKLVSFDESADVNWEKVSKVFEDRSFKLNLPTLQTERHDVQGVSEEVANEVIARAQGRCEMCDRYADTGVPMQISHTIAKGMGGTHGERSAYINSAANLRYLCEICHLKLFHGQSVRYNPGMENEISCETCWLFTVCHDTAIARGILQE